MTISRHFGWAALALVLSLGAGEARAAFILGNIPPTYTSPTYNTNGQVNTGLGTNYAVEFTANANETINTVLAVLSIQTGTVPTIGIYNATAGAIGTLVGAFTGVTTPGTAVTETYTGSAALVSGKSYFLVLDGNNFYNWSATFTGAAPTGLVPTGPGATYVAAGGSGSYAAGNVKPSFELDGVAAVPEPSSMALAGLGGAVVLAARRSRKVRSAMVA